MGDPSHWFTPFRHYGRNESHFHPKIHSQCNYLTLSPFPF